MSDFFQKAWARNGWRVWPLLPATWLYGFLTNLRRFLHSISPGRARRFTRPVVVVGNVVAGGGGKTPLVIALVQHLGKRGFRPGVVSRGYGRRSRAAMEVLPETPVYLSGDEPALIKRAEIAPVFVANKRVEAVANLLATYPETDIVIADDGLQHHALARDIEVIVFDDRGIGNGRLLPAGPLRESWPRRRAAAQTLVLHTGTQPAFAGFRSRRRLADHALAADGSRIAIDALRTRRLVAVAAIANPRQFFGMLRALGLTIESEHPWPDHDDFSTFDPAIFAGRTVLCTEKDAVKLFALPRPSKLDIFSVPLLFEPEAAFFQAFDDALANVRSPLPSTHGHETS